MSIFRKVALERLSSPEQLDQLMRVTNPTGWIALAAVGALLVAATIWGFYGSIPTEARGEGILIRQGGVAELVATGTGQVEELLVAVGDVLAAGQVVARVRQDALLREIEENEAQQAAVRADYEDLLRYAAEQRRLSADNLAQQRADLERSIATFERQVELLEERAAAQRDLLQDGLITRQTLLATEQETNTARDQLAANRLELNGLELERLESEQQVERQLESRRGDLRNLELSLRELSGSLAENVRVISPHHGRVLELAVGRGDVVSPGTPILSLEVTSEDLLTVLYLPAGEGKRIRSGMEATVSPSTVQREEYGLMLGTVTWVAEYPSTSRGMLRLLGNQELVTRLLEEGPPIQVNIALTRDPATATGYRWTSSGGPEVEISSGTLAGGSVVLRRDRPISLLLPWLRSTLGTGPG
jgi:HlyD family secretion protein